MSNFEDILRESAVRLSRKDNQQLRVPHNPMSQNHRTYWGWVVTPIAAAAGVVLGLFLPILSGKANESMAITHTTDTIHLTQMVTDTIYLPQMVEKEKIVEKIKYVTQTANDKSLSGEALTKVKTSHSDEVPACTSIQCDGINYSLLVSN